MLNCYSEHLLFKVFTLTTTPWSWSPGKIFWQKTFRTVMHQLRSSEASRTKPVSAPSNFKYMTSQSPGHAMFLSEVACCEWATGWGLQSTAVFWGHRCALPPHRQAAWPGDRMSGEVGLFPSPLVGVLVLAKLFANEALYQVGDFSSHGKQYC